LPVFVFILWPSFTLKALDPDKSVTQYSMRIWNMEGGLPSNTVYAVRQTQDGYLWIGTRTGLVRFDGINFELYTTKNIPQLKDNVIRALYQDRKGTLWIGTDSGGLTRYNQGEFTTYPITTYNALYKIRAINEDRWGNLWIGSFTRGLTCLSNNKFTTYTTKQGLPHDQVRFISKDAHGDLWAAAAEGIFKVIKPGVFQEYAPGNLLSDMKTACLYEADSGNLWVGTGKSGLTRWKNGKFTAYGVEAGVPNPIITYLYRDRLKSLWIGTDGGGLTRMSNGIFSTFPGADGLAGGYVYSIYEDREGSLWVGTLDGGLYQLKDSKFTTYTTGEGLVHDYVYCIRESREGGLWIGTKQGLNRWKNGKITTVPAAGRGSLNNPVLSVYEDRSGYTWIGTIGGLHRFKDGKLITLTEKHGLSDNIINCIYEDRQGIKWIGTENGLNRFNSNTGTFIVFSGKQGLCSNFIECIFADTRGNLWIGTDAGLNCLRDGVISVINPAAGRGDNYFRCAYEDKGGTLWFGSDGGLIRLKQKEATLFTIQSGLTENYVYSILEDERGYLWLAGRSGISRVRKNELEDFARGKIRRVRPDWYNEKDGMKSGWCTDAGCKTRDGKLWFPTGKGVAMIDPNHIKPDPLVPVPIVEKLIVDGEIIPIKSVLKLAPGKRRLEFYYTVLSFTHPGKIRFKLKLSGYDSDWVEVGTVRNTNYNGLSPGRYTFQVKACNTEGVWNEVGASFSFYMKPHWYKTWWAFTLYVLSAFLGVFFFFTWRSRKLKREKQRLEGIVTRRTMEINRKNLQLHEQSDKLKEMDRVKSRFFANISHEFRTPLTLIMGPLEQILAEDPDREMKTKVNLMLRNSRRLLTLVNQLLELAKFESGKMQLEASLHDIVSFTKNIVMCFESLARQNEVDLIFKSEEEEIFLYLDPEKLEKIIANLLANAFNYTPAGGKITVSLRKIEEILGFPGGCVEISIRDTGSGIPPEQLPYIFDRFYRGEPGTERKQEGAGIGLALTKELIGLHHGEIDVRSRVGKNSGTEFMIRFPLAADRYQSGEIVDIEKTGDFHEGPGFYPANQKENGREPGHETGETGMVTAEPAITAGEQEKDIILVVEDNTDVRDYIRGALEPQYIVREAADGKEGIKKAGEIVPDLVISDIMMPGMDGYELCRRLKQDVHTSHIPIIILTAKASEESILTGLATRADDYIIKPFNINILKARISNLIGLRRQMQLKRQRQMALEPEEMSVTSIDETFYKELQGMIEANLDDPEFNVEAMSKKLYINRATLYRKIHALTGVTPTDFIRSYRLKRAAQLLKAKVGNVTEVSFRVGFSNSAYFSRCFKDKFHRVPSDFIGTEEPGKD
jgi:signal transduction histidine kinase/ligand-binding sensor domain-containing protein/DNA-binding response OmpR family regulator